MLDKTPFKNSAIVLLDGGFNRYYLSVYGTFTI